MFKDLLAGCASLVFPPICYYCQKTSPFPDNKVLCASCIQQLKNNTPPFCIRCSRHLYAKTSLCRSCRSGRIYFDFAFCALEYNPALKFLLHQFKYHHKTALRRPFSALMLEFIRAYNLDLTQFDLILPVPMFASKLRMRGYNQSALLAKSLSKRLAIPCRENILVKARPTRPQSDLKRKERWTNLSGAFTIKHSVFIRDKRVLLVDDLLTTGATASLAARTLKEADCRLVGVLTLAAVS